MRYRVTLANGERWMTDFEPGDPLRRPDGTRLEGGATVIAQGCYTNAPVVNICWPRWQYVESVVDTDCG